MKKINYIAIIKWAALVLFCISAAFLVEKYAFDRPQGVTGELKLEDLTLQDFNFENGELVTTSDTARIYFVVNDYVDKIRIIYHANETVSLVGQESLLGAKYTTLAVGGNVLTTVIDGYRSEQILTFTGICSEFRVSSIEYVCDNSFHWQRFVYLSCFFVALAVILAFGLLCQYKPERLVLTVGILLGIATLAVAPYEKISWDDETHFANAYKVASSICGDEVVWTKATDDFINLRLFFAQSYEDRLQNRDILNDGASTVTNVTDEVSINYILSNIDIVPTALGIIIARLLFKDFATWFIMARLIDILFYFALVYFSVKIIPIGKELLALIAMTPTAFFLVATYNTDYFMNGFLFLATAAFFHEYYSKEKVSKKYIAVFLISMLIGCARKLIYIPIVLIAFLIPKDRYLNKKSRIIYRLCYLATILFEMGIAVFSASGLADNRGGATSVSDQLSYVLQNPIRYLIMYAKSFLKTCFTFVFGADAKLSLNIYGTKSGSVEIIMVIVIVLLWLFTKSQGERFAKMKVFDSIFCLAILAIVVSVVWGAMYLTYTPVGADTINGVQARYYTSLLMLLFLFVPCPRVTIEMKDRTVMKLTCLAIVGFHLVTIYSTLMMA